MKSPFPGYNEAEAVLSLGAEYLPPPFSDKGYNIAFHDL